jgi:hypothetical protein
MTNTLHTLPYLENELGIFFDASALFEVELAEKAGCYWAKNAVPVSFYNHSYEAIFYFTADGEGNFLFCLFLKDENGAGRQFEALFPQLAIPEYVEEFGFTPSEYTLRGVELKKLQWIFPVVYCDSRQTARNLWSSLGTIESFAGLFNDFMPDWDLEQGFDYLMRLPHREAYESQEGFWFADPCFAGELAGWPFPFIPLENNFLSVIKEFTAFDVHGSIFRPMYTDYFNLKVPLVRITFEEELVQYLEVYFEFVSPSYYLSEAIELYVEGNLGLGGTSRYELSLQGAWIPGRELIEFKTRCAIREIPFFSVSELPGFENKSTDLEVGLGIQIVKSSLKIHQLDFELHLDEWALIPDILHLEQLRFDVEVYDPEDLRLIRADVSASALLGKKQLRLYCSGSYPSGYFQFELDSDTPLHIHDLMEAFIGYGLVPDHLVVSALNASYNVNSKDLEFAVEVSGDSESLWDLGLFKLERLKLRLSGFLPDIHALVEGEIQIRPENEINGVRIPVSTQYLGSERGWLLRGGISQLEEDTPLSLSDVLQQLSGSNLMLPGNQTIGLAYFDISYQTASKALSVTAKSSGALNIPIGSLGTFTLEGLDLSFQKEEQISASLSAITTLKLGGVPLSWLVSLEYTSAPVPGENEEELLGSSWRFSASSREEIKLAELANWFVSELDLNVPLPASLTGESSLTDLFIEVNTREKTFEMGGLYQGFTFDDLQGDIELRFRIEKDEFELCGNLKLEDPNTGEPYLFALKFDKDPDSKFLFAQYQGNLTLQKVVGLFNPEASASIPSWLSPSMEELFFLLYKNKSGGKWQVLLALNIDLGGDGIDLSKLEFIGRYIPKNEATLTMSLDFAFSSADITSKDEIQAINNKLTGFNSFYSLPDDGKSKGLSLNPTLNMPLLGFDNNKSAIPKPPENTNDKAPKTNWQPVRKQYGPVFIEKAGVTMEHGRVKILLDAGMEVGGFMFRMLDFAIQIPMKPNVGEVLSDIELGLSGLELNLTKGDVVIAGGFYKQVLTLNNKKIQGTFTGYVGEIRVMIGPKSLTAIGGYVQLRDTPSFFLYAVAQLPLGGPAEFFIDGFAGGFGINSSVEIPPIREIRNFIMVKSAFGEPYFEGDNQASNLSKAFESFPPLPDSYWVAIGIKANHYKFVESFFLAIISFGDRLELDVLGLARVKMPKGGEKLVKAELQIHARFAPEEGVFRIDGEISDGSYILNPMAKLSGGFAFYSWLTDQRDNAGKTLVSAGDFVISLGGYSPYYKKPAHYPDVPRLSLTYRVNEDLFIKAQAYFALTPKMFMAGGRLDGVFETDWVRAQLVVEAHFLVNFEPFQYSLRANISIHGSVFLLLGWASFNVGASIALWGPEFGGFATIDLGVFDFTIYFGKPAQPPLPISWEKFRESFLPADAEINKIFIAGGVIRELKADQYSDSEVHYTVNAADLIIRVESAIPARKSYVNGQDITIEDKYWQLGIAPMNVKKEQFSPGLEVEFIDNKTGERVTDFYAKPIQKAVPASLWGTYNDQNLNGASLLGLAPETAPITGYEFYPRSPEPGLIIWETLSRLKENELIKYRLLLGEIEPSDKKIAKEDGPTYLTAYLNQLNSPDPTYLDFNRTKNDQSGIAAFNHLTELLSPGMLDKNLDEQSLHQFLDQYEDAPLMSPIGADSGHQVLQKLYE